MIINLLCAQDVLSLIQHKNNETVRLDPAGGGFSMEKTDSRYALSVWRGEFIDRATEQAYRQHEEKTTARSLITALWVWGTLVILFGVLDYIQLGATEGFYLLFALRLISTFFIAVYIFFLKRRPALATGGQATTAVEIIGFPVMFMIFFVRPEITSWNIGVISILLISLFIFVPNRATQSAIAALFGLVGTVYSIALKEPPVSVLIGLAFVLMLPSVIGYVAAVRLQRGQRRQFAMLNETVRINKSLQEEILRREELEVELKRQATTDPLTGLFNRRQYEMLFRREQERLRRYGARLSLCVLDLDHFKRINDQYGHDLGDQALKHVANLFVATLRHSDIVGRFGGEEFILLLPDTDLDSAMQVINRLRERLQKSPLDNEGQPITLTATFAVTEVQVDDTNIEDVIRRADKGLYDGKAAGRNRVISV